MRSNNSGAHSAGSHSAPSHSSGSRSKSSSGRKRKRISTGKIISVFAVALIVFLAVIFIPKLISALSNRADLSENEEPVPEEVTPEPVDLREYKISFPEGPNDAVNKTLEGLKDSIVNEFNQKHDGSEPALLETSFISGTSESVFNFILTVKDGEESTTKTVCISGGGEIIDNSEVFDENCRQYLKDYINLVAFTKDAYINDNGVIVIWQDIPEVLSDAQENYDLFLLDNNGGAEFHIPGELLPEGCEISGNPLAVNYHPLQKSDSSKSEDDAAVTADQTVPDSAEEVSVGTAEEQVPEDAVDIAVSEDSESQPVITESDYLNLEPPYFNDDGILVVPVNSDVLSGTFYNMRRIYPEKPMVVLTFDDGPSPDTSERILDCLVENNAVATFFEIGKNVEKYPEISQRVVETGCELGSHSYGHINMQESSYDSVIYDKKLSDDVFIAAVGFIPDLVRPPEGITGNGPFVYDQPFIGWSVDTLDWLSKNPSSIVSTVKNAGNLDGHVILMHSIYATSVTAAEELIPWLKNEGYQLVTISELMEYCYRIEMDGHYYYAYDYFKHGRPSYDEVSAEG